jgi:hypothetical protein
MKKVEYIHYVYKTTLFLQRISNLASIEILLYPSYSAECGPRKKSLGGRRINRDHKPAVEKGGAGGVTPPSPNNSPVDSCSNV